MTLGPAYTEYKERRARESGVESLYVPLMNRASLALSLDSSQLAGHVSDEKADREAFTLCTHSCRCLGGRDRHTHTHVHAHIEVPPLLTLPQGLLPQVPRKDHGPETHFSERCPLLDPLPYTTHSQKAARVTQSLTPTTLTTQDRMSGDTRSRAWFCSSLTGCP